MSRSCFADFHIHSKYSGATSDKMVFENIAREAEKKGLDIVGTGDILHPKWSDSIEKDLQKITEGIYRHPYHETKFLPTTEVEDSENIHHLIIIPSLSKVEELREELKPFSDDLYVDGRPTVDLEGFEIVEKVSDVGGLIGPCHAFTPWTSIYKEHDSLSGCYNGQLENVDFLELGLSADTSLADKISELKELTFLSNSDAHSPWPDRLGREVNVFDVSDFSVEEVFERIREGDFRRNIGLDPKMGRYHLTACSECHEKYSVEEAVSSSWRCDECDGPIKKGVFDRICELSNGEGSNSPDFRPKYQDILPLSKIIQLALGYSSSKSKSVQKFWDLLVEEFEDELTVLTESPVSEISEISDGKIGEMIRCYREGDIDVAPGGGGKYGELVEPEGFNGKFGDDQKSIEDF